MHITAAKARHLRGTILKLLYTNHQRQDSRFTDAALGSALVRGLGFDASQNEVVTSLQDLQARGYVAFQFHKDKRTGGVRLTNIELCPSGRDLVEETNSDPAVELEP